MKLRSLFLILLLSTATSAQQRLLVVGGGSRPPEAVKKFVEWSGGTKANILVITWATAEPEASFTALRENFSTALPQVSITHAAARPLDVQKRAAFIEQLDQATGIFFSGGDQNRIMDVLADEDLLQRLKKKYNSGTAFGGTSAGAAVMSDPMMTGEADLKILDGSKVGVRKGLGLLPNVIFDQHFLVRQRHNRLFGLVMKNAHMLGIGIDEGTAVLIEDNRRLTVSGKTQVMTVHAKKFQAPYLVYFLNSGEAFDVEKRKPIQINRKRK